MQLARMGSISTPGGINYDPSDESRRIAAEKDRKRLAQINLAREGLTQKEFERTTGEDAQRRDVMRNYHQDSVARDTIPLGVINPRLVDEREGMGPMKPPNMRSGKLEQSTMMDLANINPDFAESFRTGRQADIQGAEDRNRRIATEEATERRAERELTETERKNREKENIDWFNARTSANARPKPTAGQEAIDREFAKEIVDWSMGGASAFEKDMSQLEEALNDIAPLDPETGRRVGARNISGPIFGRMPDLVQQFIGGDKPIDVRDRVQDVVQKSLRQILGGQFAMKEGEQLIARAYNPAVSPEVNARRLERLLPQMRAAAEAKEDAAAYFNKNGTLEGYDLRSLSDAMEGLRNEVEGYRSDGPAKAAPKAPSREEVARDDGVPTVNTQEEFDALPSGAEFMENGVRYRKP